MCTATVAPVALAMGVMVLALLLHTLCFEPEEPGPTGAMSYPYRTPGLKRNALDRSRKSTEQSKHPTDQQSSVHGSALDTEIVRPRPRQGRELSRQVRVRWAESGVLVKRIYCGGD